MLSPNKQQKCKAKTIKRLPQFPPDLSEGESKRYKLLYSIISSHDHYAKPAERDQKLLAAGVFCARPLASTAGDTLSKPEVVK